jgi:hypothetical protein
LAFDQHARYDSPNFLWFGARYPRFVYVDRIVVAASARGLLSREQRLLERRQIVLDRLRRARVVAHRFSGERFFDSTDTFEHVVDA